MPIVIPPITGTGESLVFDGLDLNPPSGSPWAMTAVTINPPAKRPEWAQSGDTDGAALIRKPLKDTRSITFTLQTAMQARDAVHAAVQTLTAKIEEAEARAGNGDRGLPIVWTPEGSSTSLAFHALTGSITEIPITMESGYFATSVQLNVELTCEPYGEGPETQVATVTSSDPLIALEIPPASGDISALGRMVVEDAATQVRRYASWGIESRDYDATTALRLDLSSLLTLSGFGGASTTHAGSVASNVARLTLLTQPVAVVGTAAQAHVGTFRVSVRIFVDSPDAWLRFSYRDGSGTLTALAWRSPPTSGWCDVDLGLITIPRAASGLQVWSGQIDAQRAPSATTVPTLDIDTIYLTPAGEGWGKSRAAWSYDAPAISAFDDFSTLGSGTGLGGYTADAGGNWATSGAATDFAGTSPAGGSASRATNSVEAAPRLAILGSSAYADTEVSVLVSAATVPASSTTNKISAAVARYIGPNDYAWAFLQWGTPSYFAVGVTVGGVRTFVAVEPTVYGVPSAVAIRLLCFRSGRMVGMLVDAFGNPVALSGDAFLSGSHADIASGGALSAGKAGFYDQSTASSAALTRTYRAFTAGGPAAEEVVIYSGRTLEFRTDEYLRQDSSGTIYGRAPGRRGSPFLIPEGGDGARKSRVAVKVRRTDIETGTDDGPTDATTITVFATPRYLNLPH